MSALLQRIQIGFYFFIVHSVWGVIVWSSLERIKTQNYRILGLNINFLDPEKFKWSVAALSMFPSFFTTYILITAYEKGERLTGDVWYMLLVSMSISILTTGVIIKIFFDQIPDIKTIISVVLLVLASLILHWKH